MFDKEPLPNNQQEKTPTQESSPTLEGVSEAYRWHELFEEGWLTAHELSELESENTPESTGELFKVETENLREIKKILDENADDGDFRTNLENIRDLLPRPFSRMEGVYQTSPHEDIDPIDHTLNALHELDTDGLSVEDRLMARLVLVFHDIGKVEDTWNREHPRRSAEMAEDYLKKMGYTQEQVGKISHHIKWHDALGDVSRTDGRNIFNARDVLTFFRDEVDLEIHRRIAVADISSIPGLREYVPNVLATHAALLESLRRFQDREQVEPGVALPFEPIGIYQYQELYGRLSEEENFDEIDIDESMARRRGAFEQLSREDREVLEKTIIQESLENSPRVLEALKLTGREIDETFVDELEKKYDVPLSNLRVAENLFGLTYKMWELNWEVQGEPDMDLVRSKLEQVKRYAENLARFEVLATHATNEHAKGSIDESRALLKSTTGSSSHYEGEGVYTGILGSYRGWAEGALYEVKLSLADSVPIIVSYNYPKAMANVLGEVLDIEEGTGDRAVAHGLIEWFQTQYDDDDVSPWKIELLENLLGAEAKIVTDEHDLPCVIVNTQEDPIVWGSLCRSLRIRRFIPASELQKAAFDRIREPQREVKREEIEMNYPYEAKPVRVLRLHGMTRTEFEEFMEAI